MKAYSIDLREKIVKAYEQGNTSIRKVAGRFGVAKSFVQKLLSLQQTQGHVAPKKQGGNLKGELTGSEAQLAAMVETYPDATLLEYCEYWGTTYNQWVSPSTMCRGLQKQKLTLKKKTLRSSQAQTERVQNLRVESWQQVQQVDPENLVFIDEMGVLLGLTRPLPEALKVGGVCFPALLPRREGERHWSHQFEASFGSDDVEWFDAWRCL